MYTFDEEWNAELGDIIFYPRIILELVQLFRFFSLLDFLCTCGMYIYIKKW